ncbi:MAG TPA: hypothetical protein VFK05_31365 [Polyangiaceae bacterium]|nr:hypothetical protein [Polyangiaceae bacterium]
MEEQLFEIHKRLIADLVGLRPRLGNSWEALQAALRPTLEVLENPISTVIDHAHVSSSWESEARSLDEDVASNLSFVLIRVSDALKACYRAQTPRELKIAEAISTFYVDVQRPLWAAHPTLRPFDV